MTKSDRETLEILLASAEEYLLTLICEIYINMAQVRSTGGLRPKRYNHTVSARKGLLDTLELLDREHPGIFG